MYKPIRGVDYVSGTDARYIIIVIYVMELGHLLTRSGLTYPEVS